MPEDSTNYISAVSYSLNVFQVRSFSRQATCDGDDNSFQFIFEKKSNKQIVR